VERLLTHENDLVFFPDEGSCKRYSDCINKKCAFGIKKREWRTGEHFIILLKNCMSLAQIKFGFM